MSKILFVRTIQIIDRGYIHRFLLQYGIVTLLQAPSLKCKMRHVLQ